MKNYLECLLNQNEKPLGTVLYIGAGTGSELAALSSLDPTRIVAVEASKELYSTLNRKSKKYANISAVNAWVLPPGQKSAEAFLYNNPRYNALGSINNIDSTHPNVKMLERVTISGEPLDSFIGDLQIDAKMANVLVIDIHNAKGSLLQNAKDFYLQHFDFLIMVKSDKEKKKSELSETEPLYSFDEVLFASEEVKPFEFFVRNEKICKLRAQLESVQAIETVNKEQLLEIAGLKEKVEQIQPAKEQAETEVAKLRDELASIKQNTQIQSDKDSLEHQKLKGNIEELNGEVSALKSLNEEAELALSECTKERDAEHKWHKEHKSWAESLNSQKAQLEAELAEKNSSISLIQKMHAKAQIDLDNLREKYSEKLSSERELVELVKELREKLTIASKYYFKLQQEHPELLASDTNGKES